jgi:glucoside 3-dehydrogenase (cytochrome c) hitch-hiker subunit
MLGAIGVTCAFPFEGDELYGQHVHTTALAQTPAPSPYAPVFLTAAEYSTIARLTDVIIPPTDTPGAAAAGVPEYIDRVVALNAEHQPLIRAGLAWLEQQASARFSREFLSLGDADRISILQPLSDAIDRQQRDAQRQRFRTEPKGGTVYYVAITDRDPLARSPSSVPVPLEKDRDLPVRFFRLVKNLTADGYYTSRVGLIEELGYAGNTVLARFPACAVPEH